MILLGIDVLYWLTFAIYISGGFYLGEHQQLGAIQEVFRVAAFISIIALFSGVDLNSTKFIKGWKELGFAIQEKRKPRTPEGLCVSAGCGVLILLFFLAPLIRHWNFGTWAWDLGALMNIIWRGGHGYGFTFTVLGPPGAPARNFLLHSHLSPWLFPMSWIYRILPYAETLIFFQSLALVTSMVPLYLLAKRFFPKNISPLLLPVFYWCFDTVHHVNMWDVHENSFITVFALWALYFFSVEKYYRCALFTLCVALFKEDAWVIAGAMSCFFLFSKGHRFWGAAFLFLGFFVFIYYSVTGAQTQSLGGRYGFLGSNFSEAGTTVLAKPWLFLVQLAWPGNFLFCAQMVMVAGGLWLLGGWSLFMMAPVFFEIILSTYDGMRSPNNHYIYPIAGPLFFSAALGLKKLEGYFSGSYLIKIVTTLTLICITQLKYSEASTIQSIIHSESWRNRHCLDELVRVIPEDAPIYGRNPFFTRLANRPVIWLESDLSRYPELGWAITPIEESIPPTYEIAKSGCGFQVIKPRGH